MKPSFITRHRRPLFLSALAFAISGFGGFASAASPQNVRLDQDGAMAHVLEQDQGAFPTCWSTVAAEMIDAWRFSHGDARTGLHTSPLKFADDVWHLNRRPSYTGGDACKAINQMRANPDKFQLCNDVEANFATVAGFFSAEHDGYISVFKTNIDAQLEDLINRFKRELSADKIPVQAQNESQLLHDSCAVMSVEDEITNGNYTLLSNYEKVAAINQLAEDLAGPATDIFRTDLEQRLSADADFIEKFYSSALPATKERLAVQYSTQLVEKLKESGLNIDTKAFLKAAHGSVPPRQPSCFSRCAPKSSMPERSSLQPKFSNPDLSLSVSRP